VSSWTEKAAAAARFPSDSLIRNREAGNKASSFFVIGGASNRWHVRSTI